eukprot:14741560-Alexandrium_andersonii.AAC.1
MQHGQTEHLCQQTAWHMLWLASESAWRSFGAAATACCAPGRRLSRRGRVRGHLARSARGLPRRRPTLARSAGWVHSALGDALAR